MQVVAYVESCVMAVIDRRFFVQGLIATPAVVAASSLMPVRLPAVLLRPPGMLTLTMITREAAKLFTSSNYFIASIERQYEDEFGQSNSKIGSQLRIRLPNDLVTAQ